LIGESATAVRREGNILFFQALLETDGQQSHQFLEASFKAGLAPSYLEENIYLMAQYYLALENYGKVGSTAEAYLQQWERGKYRDEMLRLAAVGFERTGDSNKAQRYRSLLERENPDSRFSITAKLDRAVSLYQDKKYMQAQKICRNLRAGRYSTAAAPALYMLSYYSLEQKRMDDAILYYNILREAYPYAVGLDELIDRFSGMERKTAGDTRAEQITGTIYSVQVGVFSEKDNANTMARRMKGYGMDVDINDKYISDKKYYVVYVGRFVSSEEAMSFKTRLEASENEAFHVVAR